MNIFKKEKPEHRGRVTPNYVSESSAISELRSEIKKLKFQLNNPPKYMIGDVVMHNVMNDCIILDVELDYNLVYPLHPMGYFYKYEVFNKETSEKEYIPEDELFEKQEPEKDNTEQQILKLAENMSEKYNELKSTTVQFAEYLDRQRDNLKKETQAGRRELADKIKELEKEISELKTRK